MNLPLRWDAGWYLDIAVGYRWSPAAEGQQNVAFFPAYPALMSLGAALVNAGNEPEGLGVRLSYERYYVWHLAAGLVVALAAFLWGLAYVYRLAREDLDDRSATSAVLLLCAFPFAVFYGAPYSESLFLLATVAAFFHARRGEWGVACVWGALAGLTRPNGFVLCAGRFAWGLAYVRLAREDLDDRSATRVLLLCASGGCAAARRTGRVLVVPAGPHRQSARLARRPSRLGALDQRRGHAARLPPGAPDR